jgi:hypothetical protein
MGLLERRERPELRAQPRVVARRPRLLRAGEAAAVAEQEFREPMARAEQIRADVLAAPKEVSGGFLLLGRDVNRRQRPGAVQDRELRRIPPIGLDPVAGPPRNQRGRDHVTGDTLADQRSLQVKAARARLVTAPNRPLTL